MNSLLPIVIVTLCATMSTGAPRRPESVRDHHLKTSAPEDLFDDDDLDDLVDEFRSLVLEYIIIQAKIFETKYSKILAANVTDTRVDSALSTFITLLMLLQAAKRDTAVILMDGLNFRGHDIETVQSASFELIEWLESHFPVKIKIDNDISVGANFSMSIDPAFSHLIDTYFSLNAVHISPSQNYYGLMNQVHFEGRWKNFAFTKAAERYFYVNNRERVSTEYMYTSGEFRHGRVDNLNSTFIEFPFESYGEERGISMFILWSDNENDYQQLINHLGMIDVEQLIRDAPMENITVYLPKFQICTRSSPNSWISQFFTPENPFGPDMDLSGISNSLELIFDRFQYEMCFRIKADGLTNSARTEAMFKVRHTRSSENEEKKKYIVNRPFAGIVATTGMKSVKLFTLMFSGSTLKYAASDCRISKK